MIVYLLRNRITGKLYIGKTNGTLTSRWSGHVHAALKQSSNTRICNAIRKYGPQSFDKTILGEALTTEELNEKEQLLISFLGTTDRNRGYNISAGGETGTLGLRMSEESKIRMSLAARGRKKTALHRQRIGEANKGKPWHGHYPTQERVKATERMIGNTHALGMQHSEETKQKISAALKGRKFPTRPAAWSANISAAKKGVPSPFKGVKRGPRGPLPEETKLKISRALMGHSISPENLKKMNDARKLKRSGAHNAIS